MKDTLIPFPLGKKVQYTSHYNANLLFPIPRKNKRKEIGIDSNALPFYGFDYWNHYEVSWLNLKGKPVVALAEIVYDCHSLNIIESKSMKLYFNALNNTPFLDLNTVQTTIKKDLEAQIKAPVSVNMTSLHSLNNPVLHHTFDGISLDTLDITCTHYVPSPNHLTLEEQIVNETVSSDLFKSNCPVTGQPDWGSIQINYTGKKINHEGLLRYLISFRNHSAFHEQCIERIFMDIWHHCHPLHLTIQGHYTRRGGIDINPYRSSEKAVAPLKHRRLYRQ